MSPNAPVNYATLTKITSRASPPVHRHCCWGQRLTFQSPMKSCLHKWDTLGRSQVAISPGRIDILGIFFTTHAFSAPSTIGPKPMFLPLLIIGNEIFLQVFFVTEKVEKIIQHLATFNVLNSVICSMVHHCTLEAGFPQHRKHCGTPHPQSTLCTTISLLFSPA